MDSSWKRIIYLICTIQVGGGYNHYRVVSFIPLFLAELGLHDPRTSGYVGRDCIWCYALNGST